MTDNSYIKLLIADDHEIYLDGLRLLFDNVPGIKIAGEANNGLQLVELFKAQQADVILTDIVMPIMDGIAAVKEIHAINPETGIIALSMFDEEHYIADMLEAGAMGYLLKNADKEEVINAIHQVYKGFPYYCSRTSKKMAMIIAKSRFNPYENRKLMSFTDKEAKIIQFICREKTNREIGEVMFMSPRTIEWHRLKIQQKMDVSSTAGIVVYAIKTGMFKIDE